MLRKSIAFALQELSCTVKRHYWHRMGYRPKNIEPGYFPFPKRQVPVDGQKSYSDRLKDITSTSELTTFVDPVNIGFKFDTPKRVHRTVRLPELESLARCRRLQISIDEVHCSNEDPELPLRRFLASKHYGIYNDLFGSRYYFTPVVDVRIFYPLSNSSNVIPVYHGNHIYPKNAMSEPLIDFSTLPKNSLWTLIMIALDEPLSDENSGHPVEYIHWMIANIHPEICDDNAPREGDLIVSYLPPLPYYGTGFHRYAFLLFRQDNGSIDFSQELRGRILKSHHEERVFSTLDFYQRHQDALTPAGLAFYQASWDKSVRSYFQEHLPNVDEPIFEIQYPAELPPPQARFPLADSWFHSRRHPAGLPLANSRLGVHEDVSFDVYLDRYRDRREMDQELVQQRLANEGNPLDPNRKRSQSAYPLASPPLPSDNDVPSWWKQQEIQRRLRKGRWSQLDGHED